ncbi:DEAD/DEAH box helicase family protein [candidate division KSB1 bacterium]|nr:DEAD/DEAH box helicase family protein [candidate division KSB1 bacterium]
MSKVDKYLSIEVIESIQQAVLETGGNEVFFVGYTEEDLIVHKIDVIARGNESAVPAVLKIAREADVVIHNHPSGLLKPSAADLSIASGLDRFSVAFYIVNNIVSDIYVVVEPFKKKKLHPVDAGLLKKILEPGGPVSGALSGYEERPQQLQMIETVSLAFNQKKLAVIEAGTGTGKTMAYLLPAIHWAVQNKDRVVVSTNTINLQEQLVKKDIPLLKKVLDLEFDAVLVKGRSNYVCLRKVDEVESDFTTLAEEDEIEELKNLITWARHSKDGSKADLVQIPSLNVWEKIAAESDTCTRSKCPHFRECFVNKARRNAARAQILVVNHHLLFADLAIRQQTGSFEDAAILPPYQCIIFDEAHHLENVATNYFGSKITRAGIVRILRRLHRQKKGIFKGHIHNLRNRLLKLKDQSAEKNLLKVMDMIHSTIVPQIEELTDTTFEIMDFLFEVLQKFNKNEEREVKVRMLPDNVEKIFTQTGLDQHFRDYIQSLKSAAIVLSQLIDLTKKTVQEDPDDWTNMLIEIEANAERLSAVADILQDVIFTRDEDNIRWIEARTGYKKINILHFQVSPLHVKDMMKLAVFDVFNTIVMTSATLTTDNSFAFLADRLGLNQVDKTGILELQLPAPFDYENQVVMAIPTDMPDPRHSSFASELGAAIFKSLTISRGSAFVLFTSYGLLQMIYRELEESLNLVGIKALKQGTLNRHELLTLFKKDKSSVLFATDSFWEGVDVEGDALESVIITKLPFKVPSEPIIEARYEAIEKEGGNAFMDYAVPIAVLKFKQGFGRLIRRKTDRGSVIILDNRVVSKSYGKRFLRSLPACHNVIGSKDEIYTELKKFFGS